MFLPRYSLRWLLGLTTVSAGVSLVLSYAVRGRPWALGFVAGLWSLVLVTMFYVVAFLAAWVVARGLAYRRSHQRESHQRRSQLHRSQQQLAASKATTLAQQSDPSDFPQLPAGAPAADAPPSMTG